MKKAIEYIVASQNLHKTGLKLPKHAILRVNLAWHKDLPSIKLMLKEYKDHIILLDIPIGRKKPPNNDHNVDHIADIANNSDNVKYIAISNVEEPDNVRYYCEKFKGKIVPKIETYKGVLRSADIIDALNYKPQILMLDHEDLFSDLVSRDKEKHYVEVVQVLVETCNEKKAHLLRVKGIIFSSD